MMLWIIVIILLLAGLGGAVQAGERTAQASEDVLYLMQHGKTAYQARLDQARHARRNSRVLFWGLVFAALIFFARAGHAQQYMIMPSGPCAGLPHAPVGLGDPWQRCITKYYQDQENQRVQRDNQDLQNQWQKAEDEHRCNAYNYFGCMPKNQRPQPLSEQYIQQHFTTMQYQSCAGGVDASCDWLARRHWPAPERR